MVMDIYCRMSEDDLHKVARKFYQSGIFAVWPPGEDGSDAIISGQSGVRRVKADEFRAACEDHIAQRLTGE